MAATIDGKESHPSLESSKPCRRFEFSEILLATNNFDNSLVIGKGGFGKVYKGNIISGSSSVVAAIKRLDSTSDQGAAEFWAEIEVLSKLRRCYLVSLFGYCNYEKEMILIYEYMPNGSLADHLHRIRTPISWLQRLKICISAARGLDYLHTGTGIDSGIIHRDVKSSNILLHERWAAKISDFGLSRVGPTNQSSTMIVTTSVKGSRGYLDPNYVRYGELTRKSDVYAFGVVLLEVLCRKQAVDRSFAEDHWSLVMWVQDSIEQGNLKHIIDSDIKGQISPKCLNKFVQIVEQCLLIKPKQRPTMAEVVVSLDSVMASQQKTSISLQADDITRTLDIVPFPSNGENSGKMDASSSSDNARITSFREPLYTCRPFEFPEILLATYNFDESLVIGHGGFGKVYKGSIINGSTLSFVAIKRLDPMSHQGATEFWAEVEALSRLRHYHLVSLFGYCNYEKEMILIYEYMPNGSLADHLHKFGTPISWLQRLKICIGVARALDYLHIGMGIDFVVHRDVKSSNILLNERWAAKISGIGLSKIGQAYPEIISPTQPDISRVDQSLTHISTQVKGTFVYLDPDYFYTGRLTRKSDVYAFGVVLLEVLCRKSALDLLTDELMSLTAWAQQSIKEGNLKRIIDSDIRDQISPRCLRKFVEIVEGCLHINHKKRPMMAEVVASLVYVLTLQENIQPKPTRRTIFGRMFDN